MLMRLYQFFSSVKLAVVLLVLGLFLVFFGTLAQGFLGIHGTQANYFQSLFVKLPAAYVGLHQLADMFLQGFGVATSPIDPEVVRKIPAIPVFPGGYLVGGLLLTNLFAAHLRYYRKGLKQIGIALIHIGVVMLLIGQFATDLLSNESYMTIREGDSANYSESGSHWELAFVDASQPDKDKVIAIPASLLATGKDLSHSEMPFKVRGVTYYRNSQITQQEAPIFSPVDAETSFGQKFRWRELPHATETDQRDVPSAIIELSGPEGESRKLFVSGHLNTQIISAGGQQFQMALRPVRYYKPFSLQLIDFRFDRYPGTEIPKNYSSRVRLERPDTGENRELTIRMNEPLRYQGETFFQASFDKATEQTTILQVVKNPSWLTPYFACVIVAVGMIWQFAIHLFRFSSKRASA